MSKNSFCVMRGVGRARFDGGTHFTHPRRQFFTNVLQIAGEIFNSLTECIGGVLVFKVPSELL